MTNHDQLEASLKDIDYPEGMIICPGEYCAIGGQSFFPGGKGHTGKDLPTGGVMYLGHNFDKLQGFRESVARGREENLTWRRIRDSVLPHLPEGQIWFTNYFMGLLERESNIGPIARSMGFNSFESQCWTFFKLQVSLQKPRVIVALGKEVVNALWPANRLNIPTWQLKAADSYGRLRLKV